MIEHVPTEVCTEGRVYFDRRQRRRLVGERTVPTEDPHHGLSVSVGVTVRDQTEWGMFARTATFETQLGRDGEIRIPAPARDRLDVSCGDTVMVAVVPTP
jgi:hypothetical protein